MRTVRRARIENLYVAVPLVALALLVALLAALGNDAGAASAADADDVRGAQPPVAGPVAEDDGSDDGGEPGDVERYEGIVAARPAITVGLWAIRTDDLVTLTVIATWTTRFDKGIPDIGAWVEVDGVEQPGGAILAERIRLDDYEAGEVVVRLRDGVDPQDIANEYELTRKSNLLASANIYLFAVSGSGTESVRDDGEQDTVSQLQQDSDVIWAELNYVYSVPEDDGYKTFGWGGPDPSGYTNQNAYKQIDLAPALEKYDGSGVTVAVLDTGLALTHEVFLGRVIQGYDVIADDTQAADQGSGLAWGHGTHIAGIIARVAPGATILPVRVLDANGRGNTFLLAYAIEWASTRADVINLSLGTTFDSEILGDAIDQAIEHGVIIVAAAGNDNTKTAQFPAAYEDVIGVTAVDGENVRWELANYGSDWIDLSAPGVGIASTMIGPKGVGYASWSGTSMATAFVSGAAALAREKWPALSPEKVLEKLTAAGADADATNPGFEGKLGRLLDVGAALRDAEPADDFDVVNFFPVAELE